MDPQPAVPLADFFPENASPGEAFPKNRPGRPPTTRQPPPTDGPVPRPADTPAASSPKEASPREAFPKSQPTGPRTPATRRSPVSARRPPDDPEWTRRTEEVAALLARWELASAHRLGAAAARAVLSAPEFLVLSELAVRPAGLTGAHVADIVGVGSGGISGILTRLEEQELIERGPDPTDARGMLSFATDAGRALLRDERDEPLERGLADLMRGMSLDQVRLVAEFLGLVTDRVYRQSRRLRGLPRKR